jgi:hypothetical protein
MQLGEFEYLMLAAAARLADGACGLAIRQQATGQRCSLAPAAGEFYDAVLRVSEGVRWATKWAAAVFQSMTVLPCVRPCTMACATLLSGL